MKPSSLTLCPRPLAAAIAAIAAASALFAAPAALAQEARCGPLANHYGPFDYRKEQKGKLVIVEGAHFGPQVESLRSGMTAAIGADLHYTLMTSPNHHRALDTLVRLSEREKTDKPFRMEYTVECYFDRAVRFMPDDTVVRGLFALYLKKKGQLEPAIAHLDQAVVFAADNPFSHYNLGMVYFELGQYDKAAAQARTARELGLPREELIDKLKARGQWKEPPASASASAAAAASAASAAQP